MGFLHILAWAAVLLPGAGAHAASAYSSWKWQRTILPAAASLASEQCVVLDADLYTHAAPGLRDVRLVQDGQEIAYALEESYDEGALLGRSAARILKDRSLYTTVLHLPLASDAADGRGTAFQHAQGTLLRQVPVERMELVSKAGIPPPQTSRPGPARFRLVVVATPMPTPGSAPTQRDSEVVDDVLDVASPLERTALGANLQDDAALSVTVAGAEARFSEVLLQMHQRSICYQPLSRAPLTLLFGNPDARPVHYDYAAHYTPSATPSVATLEATRRNPTYRPRVAAESVLTRPARLTLASIVALTAFLLTAIPLLRRRS